MNKFIKINKLKKRKKSLDTCIQNKLYFSINEGSSVACNNLVKMICKKVQEKIL